MKKLFIVFLLVLTFSATYSQPWTALPGGSLNGSVRSIISFNGFRWLSGNFSQAGPIPTGFIVRHDGVSWVSTSSTTNPISNFCVWNDTLYGTGSFPVGANTYGAVKWNGTSWIYFGEVPSGFGFKSISVFNNKLVFGGTCFSVNTVPINHLASWDGTVWSSFPFPITCSWLVLPDIRVVKAINGYLHVGGDFNYVNGIPAGLAFKTNGTSVVPMNLEWNYHVADFAKYHDSVFCTGNFPFGPFPTNEGSPGIVKTEDVTWRQVKHGLKMRGTSMATSLTDLYVGGSHNNACYNIPCNHDDVGNLGKWNGASWSNESSGLFNQGNEIINFLYRDTITQILYALGDFQVARGDIANYIAMKQLTIVPVRLSSFNASLQSNKEVLLSWRDETPSDQNLFEVQMSTEGIHFQKIGTVQGNDYSNYYSLEYKPTGCGQYYFHLSFENKVSDTRYVTIPCLGPKIIASRQLLTIDTKLPGTLIIISTLGQVVARTVLTTGYSEVSLSVPPGMYIARFTGQHGLVFNQKLFIQ